MPDENPLKRIMTALSYRVGATLAAGVVAAALQSALRSTLAASASNI
jgi:hypothetical protein